MNVEHDHEEYSVVTNIKCFECGEFQEACAMCGEGLHKCTAVRDDRIPRGYKVVEEFPEYMVNSQATVRHIQSQRYCILVRVTKSGGAMINIFKDGKKFTRAAQELRDKAFPNVSGN